MPVNLPDAATTYLVRKVQELEAERRLLLDALEQTHTATYEALFLFGKRMPESWLAKAQKACDAARAAYPRAHTEGEEVKQP